MSNDDAAVTNAPQFCHLHTHSEYSLIDGAIRIKDLVRHVKSLGHQAVAMTDHANLFGAVEFYSTAKSEGIKPIIGSEIYHDGGEETLAVAKELEHKDPRGAAFHLVLLAKNNEGYKNLMKAVSSAYALNRAPLPIMAEDALDAFSGGLIALSACARGELGYLVSCLREAQGPGDLDFERFDEQCGPINRAIARHFSRMLARFGEGNYYVELIDNNLPAQARLVVDLVQCARHFDIPLVASCDAHYLNAEYREAHAALLGIKHSLTMSKVRGRLKNAVFHVLNNEEMQAKFGRWPDALANTLKIADQCDVTFEFGKFFLPKFTSGQDEGLELCRIATEMLEERFEMLGRLYGPTFDETKREEYRARLAFELDVINQMGFPGYFLIVQDFINWAKRQDIPVGPGRGSGAGSLVAYALRITDIDPLPYNLVFERFLNPERISMPDFDVDFCQDRRDEVIRYVNERYGASNVAQITTFGKMLAKAAVRDVGRVLDMGYGKVDKIAKLIPNELGITLAEALEKEPRLREEAERDDATGELLKLARQVEGLARHTSVHAAGIVISDGPMVDYVPIYTVEGEEGQITQFEMKNAEKVGLVKFDFLGLKTLTVIDRAVKLIQGSLDKSFEIALIPMADQAVFQLVSAAHTVGIFQLESQGMQQLLLKLRPNCFEDIIAVVALFRPGPLGSGMVDDFIERKHGRQKIDYPLPQLEDVLRETYGIILYQEQVMKIAGALASYSLGEADLLRRAMGKKKPEEMAKQKSRFVEGAKSNGIDEGIADSIFDLMAKFAEYGFNKSHSAAYGLVSYQTAFLKAHYPDQFMAAIMTCDLDNTDKIVRYIRECRRLKIDILPPDINASELGFSVPQKAQIRFGLQAIKGIGGAVLAAIVEERQQNGVYETPTSLARRVNLHRVGKKTLELLIQVGALDSFGFARRDLIKAVPDLVKFSEQHHEAKTVGQRGLFDDLSVEEEAAAPQHSWDLLPKDGHRRLTLAELVQEKQLLGFFLSGHPLDFFLEDQRRVGGISVAQLENLSQPSEIQLVAILSGVSERLTKTGSRMAYVNLLDHTGSFEAVMFEKDLPATFPPSDTPVVVKGRAERSFDGQTIRFRCEAVKPLEEERRKRVQMLTLRLACQRITCQAAQTDAAELEGLAKLLDSNPGQTPLQIELAYPDAVVKIKELSRTVTVSDALLLAVQESPLFESLSFKMRPSKDRRGGEEAPPAH